ncbi:MAG: hypothetical protein IJS08_17155 [Victivallales bacterium]|nr:hypothetical protein [Victivallales bacterium]
MSSRIKESDPNEDTQEVMGSISSPGNEAIIDGKPKLVEGKQDAVELDEATFSRLSPNNYHVCRELNCKLEELAQSGRIDAQSLETLRYALDAMGKGERCLIQQLIPEAHAAFILGMDVNALRKSKYLRQFLYRNQVHFLNTEVYDLLDRKEHCLRRSTNNPTRKNAKDRGSVRARKSVTDGILRHTVHEITVMEEMCMSIDYRIREFVRQGHYKTESLIKPRDIYDILNTSLLDNGYITANLALLCAKFGCVNVAGLAYLLEATEDEIRGLLNKANIKMEDAAQYWERQMVK